MVPVADVDMDNKAEPESETETGVGPELGEGEGPPGAGSSEPQAPEPARPGPGRGLWIALGAGVLVLAVAVGMVGYWIGRGSDSDRGASDTARTDQTICAALLAAQMEITASDATSGVIVVIIMRQHLAGLLSDSPASAVTSAVRDAYAAAGDLADGGDGARSTYEEKLAIAQYQCNKIATWNWPGS